MTNINSNNILIDKLRHINITCETHISIRFEFAPQSAEEFLDFTGEKKKIKSFCFYVHTFKNIAQVINYITATTDINSIDIVFALGVINNESIHSLCSFISDCGTIRKITLLSVEFDHESDVLFIEAINKNSGIKKLYLSSSYISNYDNISQENIKNISLSIDDIHCEKILRYLSNATHLEKLHIMTPQYADYSYIELLLDIITTYPSLTSLKISHFAIDGKILKKIMTILNVNKMLTSLYLNCFFVINTEDWENIINILEKNHTLKALHINGVILRMFDQILIISPELQTKFIESVLTIKTIEKFYFFDTCPLIENTDQICKILKNNFTIKELSFPCDDDTNKKIKKYIARNDMIASKKLFFNTKVANLTDE